MFAVSWLLLGLLFCCMLCVVGRCSLLVVRCLSSVGCFVVDCCVLFVCFVCDDSCVLSVVCCCALFVVRWSLFAAGCVVRDLLSVACCLLYVVCCFFFPVRGSSFVVRRSLFVVCCLMFPV